MAKLTRGKDQLELSLSGHPDFKGALEEVKLISGRRWDGDNKLWCFPEDPSIAERLMITVKPDMSPDVLTWVKQAKAEKQKELVTSLPEDAELMIPWATKRVPWQPEFVGKDKSAKLNGLYGYQRAFVAHAASKDNASLILADDQGLGKCGQASGAVIEYLLQKSNVPLDKLDVPYDAFKSVDDLLAYAGLEEENGPKLIIAPNSVKGTWEREIKMWLGDEVPVQVVSGTTKQKEKQLREIIDNNGWAIVNWEQIRVKKTKVKKKVKLKHKYTGEFLGWKEKEVETIVMRDPIFEDTKWLAVIADEVHRAKNRKALSTQGLWRIEGEVKLAMSGTPLMNSPDELWPVLRWLYPDQYGNSDAKHARTPYWTFYDQYVDYYEGQYGKIITGVKNADDLRFELKDRLVRRTKGEVLDLPEKVREFIPVTLGSKQRKLYAEAERQLWFEVEQAIKKGDKTAEKLAEAAVNNPNALYQIVNGASRTVRLRQIASTPSLLGGEDESAKLDTAVELILDAKKQVVVFTEFVGTCHALVDRLTQKGLKAEFFTGEVSSEERTVLENNFQEGLIDVIVGTIAAMKEGITLTAADTEIFLERHWTPAVNEQAEDRCYRIGQKNNVTVYILEAEDTVDTQKVKPTNTIKNMIVSSVIQKDEVTENYSE